MNSAIQVNGLEKKYGAHIVLKGIHFTVEKGEIFALLGVNGAGKTTTLECMEGLRGYDAGSILIDGTLGAQLQSASLPAHMRPLEAIRLFEKYKRTKLQKSVLENLGIPELAKKQYGELSTGQKRRVHLALALTGNPDILILDEPTSGLDINGRQNLHEQIRKLKKEGKTVVLASHDMAEVEELCDRIAILHGGKIVFVGTVEELAKKVGKRYLVQVKTTAGKQSVATGDIGETLLVLLEDFKRKQLPILDIRVDRGTLEQHFMKIAKGEGE